MFVFSRSRKQTVIPILAQMLGTTLSNFQLNIFEFSTKHVHAIFNMCDFKEKKSESINQIGQACNLYDNDSLIVSHEKVVSPLVGRS